MIFVFNNFLKRESAQIIMEFLFCMVIVFLMIYASIYIFRWTGVDLAERRIAHDQQLVVEVEENYLDTKDGKDGPLRQIYPVFYKPSKFSAIWNGE